LSLIFPPDYDKLKPSLLEAPQLELPPNSPKPTPHIPKPPSLEEVKKPEMIFNISVETRLTCELKESAELPPPEVPFVPIGPGSDATLKGAAGQVQLQFVSPVRFRRQGNNQVVVINQFALPNASDLYGRPLESLRNFDQFIGPIVTIVFGKNLSEAHLYEVSMSINGKDTWYYSYPISLNFPEGGQTPIFTIPLVELHKKLPL